MDTQYHIIVLNPAGGEARLLLSTSEKAKLDQAAALITALDSPGTPPGSRRGPRGRQVVVLGKTEDCALPVEPGTVFENAAAASVALGYGYNAVGLALNVAGKKGEATAILRGVELAYAENLARE